MKRIVSLGFMVLTYSSIYATEPSKDTTFYTRVNVGTTWGDSNSYFGGVGSLTNVVGKNSSRLELEGGVATAFKNRLIEDDEVAHIFAYAWKDGSEKHGEQGIGFGVDTNSKISKDVMVGLGFKAGVGYQGNKGDHFVAQSDMSNLTYYTNYNPNTTPTLATFTDNTTVYEMNLNTNVSYTINKNVSVVAQISYLHSSYSFQYAVPAGIVSIDGLGQNSLMLTAGAEILF